MQWGGKPRGIISVASILHRCTEFVEEKMLQVSFLVVLAATSVYTLDVKVSLYTYLPSDIDCNLLALICCSCIRVSYVLMALPLAGMVTSAAMQAVVLRTILAVPRNAVPLSMLSAAQTTNAVLKARSVDLIISAIQPLAVTPTLHWS